MLKRIEIVDDEAVVHKYRLTKNLLFRMQELVSTINQLLKLVKKVVVGQVLADGPAMEQGELALGQKRISRFHDMEWL